MSVDSFALLEAGDDASPFAIDKVFPSLAVSTTITAAIDAHGPGANDVLIAASLTHHTCLSRFVRAQHDGKPDLQA